MTFRQPICNRLILPAFHILLCLCYLQHAFAAEDSAVTYRGITYTFWPMKKSYDEALDHCDKNGGYLARLDDEILPEDDETELSIAIRQKLLWKTDIACVWIGLTSMSNNGIWHWFSGHLFRTQRWRPSEYERASNWHCGQVCYQHPLGNSSEHWEWGQKLCSATQAFVCQRGCHDCIAPEGVKWKHFRGLLYVVYTTMKSYTHAQNYCERNGGNLAKITSDLLPNKGGTPIAELLGKKRHMVNCRLIGLAMRNGKWVWFDGSPGNGVQWAEIRDGLFSWLSWLATKRECCAICFDVHSEGKQWEWLPERCIIKHDYVCQYEGILPTVQEAATTTASVSRKKGILPTVQEAATTTANVSRKSPRRQRKRQNLQEVVKVEDNFKVEATPLFDKRSMSESMCARLCGEMCSYFNFHAATFRCIGYKDMQNIHQGKEVEGWDLWRMVPVAN